MDFLLGFELEFQSALTMSRTREALRDKFGFRFQIDPGPRNYNFWNIVRDGSIRACAPRDWDRHPMEVISPVFDYEVGIEYIRRLFDWVEATEGGTNETTGFHIGLNIKDADIREINRTKLIMLLDEDDILDTFGRGQNEYCRSHKASVSSILADEFPLPWSEKLINHTSQTLGKYQTVNFLKLDRPTPYLEFRAMGGRHYHRRFNEIRKTIDHFKECVDAAMGTGQEDEYRRRLETFRHLRN